MEYSPTEARKVYEYNEARRAAAELQQAKIKALQDTLGNYGDFRYVDFDDFIDPDNPNWQDYTYRLRGDLFKKHEGHIGARTSVGMLISHIRDAETADDIKKQLELWNSYKPLELPHNEESYINHFIYGLNNAPYGGSKPVFPTTDGFNPVQTTASGTQGTQGAKTGNNSGGTASTQGMKTGGTGSAQTGGTGGTGGMQTGNSGSTYASSEVPKGGTKTIGYEYDPNPGGVSLAYTLRNAPEQVRRSALIEKWNRENGRSGSTYATPGMSTGGTYSTGGGIKDANGNVLTNPGGDWEYQYALQNPQYGLGMMGKMSDAQKNYLQAVSKDMGYNYNFTGATRFV